MPRAKRSVIDNLEANGFENIGRSWTHRENWVRYGGDHLPLEQDCFTLDIPAFAVAGGGFYTQVTIWSVGLISFGAVTPAQIDYMAQLGSETELASFLAAFPGEWIAAGFQAAAYGEVEFGTGWHDPVENPFNEVRHEPGGTYSDPPLFSWSDAELVCYAAFGRRDDHDRSSTNTVLDQHIGVNFTTEGFRVASTAATISETR